MGEFEIALEANKNFLKSAGEANKSLKFKTTSTKADPKQHLSKITKRSQPAVVMHASLRQAVVRMWPAFQTYCTSRDDLLQKEELSDDRMARLKKLRHIANVTTTMANSTEGSDVKLAEGTLSKEEL